MHGQSHVASNADMAFYTSSGLGRQDVSNSFTDDLMLGHILSILFYLKHLFEKQAFSRKGIQNKAPL